jgi:hypothetical protein
MERRRGAHYLKGSLKSEREKTTAPSILILQKEVKRKEMRKHLLNGLRASLCTRLKERREMASYACRRNLCRDEGTCCQPAQFLFTFQMSRILRYATTCDCGGVLTQVSFHNEETFVNTSRKMLLCLVACDKELTGGKLLPSKEMKSFANLSVFTAPIL